MASPREYAAKDPRDRHLENPEDFFEKRIRPVLVEHCYECHSAGAKRLRAGLRLDSRAGVLRGGETGPVVVSGDAAASRLVRAIRYEDPDLQMPPGGKLPGRAIADLARWVDMGLPDPRDEEPRLEPEADAAMPVEPSSLWSLKVPVDPPLPEVDDPSWCRNGIDRFILARLESAGLPPAPAASRRELIRRVTFDLTGLPPTPREIEAYLGDEAPGAYERLVDRLLASPRHGEAWGRRWLDVARYADSNGLDENLAYVNAFRYRDYVIEAFNADKPFDRFAIEQLAGDLLPPREDESPDERVARRVATGFLSIGPKMLACDDGRKMELDIVDEQLDTTSRAFLAMTMGCARCHDHKFDPITQRDYYRLAGIFKSTKTMENFQVVAKWREFPAASEAEQREHRERQERLARLSDRLEKRRREAREALLEHARGRAGDYVLAAGEIIANRARIAPDGKTSIGDLVDVDGLEGRGLLLEAESFQRGTLTVDRTNWGKDIGVLLHSGFAEYDLTPPRPGRYQLELRYAAAESRPVVVSLDGQVVRRDGARQTTGSWQPSHQRWHFEGVVALGEGKSVLRLERSSGPVPHIDKLLLVAMPAEDVSGASAASSEGKDVAAATRAVGIDELASARGLEAVFVRQWINYVRRSLETSEGIWQDGEDDDTADGMGNRTQRLLASRAELFQRAEDTWRERKGRRGPSQRPGESAGADGKPPEKLEDARLEACRSVLHDPEGPFRLPADATRFFADGTRDEIVALKKEKDELEQLHRDNPLPRAMGVTDGEVEDLAVHLRGSYLTLGETVERGVPGVLGGPEVEVAPQSSGRVELAKWLASPEHPLTARVIVNRLWLWHFGDGLVRSPDNFGALGERPTHPELLDWLARRFVEDGWSIKAMHRRMLTSATYRMSTRFDDRARSVDPENRLWWRFPRRRLRAEEIRDALLAVSGSLDLRMRGQLLSSKEREYVTGTASKSLTYDTRRRSIYLPVLRSAVYQVFQTFDFADPSVLSGERAETTIAPQALFMMNSQLVADASRRLANELLVNDDMDASARVRRLYAVALGRQATPREVDSALEFVREYRRALEQDSAVSSSGADATSADTARAGELRTLVWQGLCRVLIASSEFVYLD